MFNHFLKDSDGVSISGPLIIVPEVFNDSRGFFLENWNSKKFKSCINEKIDFVQDNHSCSDRGVIRGLHYQVPPKAQGKLVTCISGNIFDVVVDIRSKSPTFGSWAGILLTDDNPRQLWIPKGFAHGFIALSDKAHVLYKTTDFWDKDCERTIRWNDSVLNIDWQLNLLGALKPLLSEKDKNALSFKSLSSETAF